MQYRRIKWIKSRSVVGGKAIRIYTFINIYFFREMYFNMYLMKRIIYKNQLVEEKAFCDFVFS